ncbi:MAG: GspE/PulE family protein [Planctomycetaceae bacterium]
MSTAYKVPVDNSALAAEIQELLDVVEAGNVADMVLQRAFTHGATDVHLDPTASGMRIRFRVDGVLRDIIPIPKAKASTFVSRIKVLAGMDITDKRLPQDGHVTSQRLDGVPRDIRVGSSPTIYGERLVLRMMPDPGQLTSLQSLGLLDDQLRNVMHLLEAPYGLLLIVGPVGAGKTTTLYSLLKELNQPDRSVVTIEDPVERRIPGANQIQIEPKSGLTFVKALRGVLRQDPNVMCVGEIRDPETAQIACRAAMTGVLVLSTLHANDTASAVEVLRQFGLPSMAITDALRGVISQRLVRRICTDDREVQPVDDYVRDLMHLSHDGETPTIYRGIPTDNNFHTGYAGRIAVFETMPVTGGVRDAIRREKAAFEIRQVACDEGMLTLEDSARRQVLAGVTSVDELKRVIVDTRMGTE